MSHFQSTLFIPSKPEEAFEVFIDELQIAFLKNNIEMESNENGFIKKEDKLLGKIKSYKPGKSLAIEWDTITPNTANNIEISVTFEEHSNGTIVFFEPKNLLSYFHNQDIELVGWFIDNIITTIFENLNPQKFGDWITDRGARKPTGKNSRTIFSDPLYHWPNFYFLLEQMKIQSLDNVLEIGCGGGVLLREILKTGCWNIFLINHKNYIISKRSSITLLI